MKQNTVSKAALPPALERLAVQVQLKKGETVACKGQPTLHVYLILSGNVLLQVEFLNGNYYSYAQLGPSRFIGDLEVLSRQMEYVGTLIASEDTTCLRFPVSDFKNALDEDAAFMRHVVEQMSVALYETSYQRGQNRYQTSLQRLCRLLLREQSMARATQGPVRISVTRAQMASELGVNVKTINRGVSALLEEGLIGLSRGKITLTEKQVEKLKQHVEEA
ncbi:Crp/Fnr family transcriptional regulator [Clostridia bacterium OttesenSCG-928-O13]|nr:Crp/Fnr family transcriptional regulator [Clostridia bacterium OttesenSCG-928-O13]